MAIKEFAWDNNQGFDIHVLRNNQASLRLDEIAIVRDEQTPSVSTFLSVRDINSGSSPKPPDFDKVQFIPRFRSTVNAAGNHEGNGIEVDIRTGVITAKSVSGNKISNFVVDAVLSRTGTLPPLKIGIRVHVHDDIVKAWLTPSPLTIRPDANRGILELAIKYIGANPVSTINWFLDPAFTILLAPLPGSPFSPGQAIPSFNATNLFPIHRFPEGILPIPLFLEIPGASNPRTTIPTRFGHLLSVGQKFNDFEIVSVVEKGKFRFSVYAEFDDKVVGDITQHHGITWGSNAAAASQGVTLGNDGEMIANSTAVGKTVDIEATLPARVSKAGLANPKGQVIVEPSWVSSNVAAKLITNSPGANLKNEIPNVLFVSDGFTDQQSFEAIAGLVHQQLRTSPKTSPWNHLFRSSINAWTVFIKSREEAASVLYESAILRVKDSSGATVDGGVPVDRIVRNNNEMPVPTGELRLGPLIEIVGLPIASDSGKSLSTKLSEWNTLFDPSLTTSTGTGSKRVSQAIFDLWVKKFSDRRIINERDTVLGSRCGEKPRYEQGFSEAKISYNDSRIGRAQLDQLLNRITDSTGTVIGNLWGRDAIGNKGKDYNLVVILSGGTRLIGTRVNETNEFGTLNPEIIAGLFTSLSEERTQMTGIAGPTAIRFLPFVKIKPDPISSRALKIDPFAIPSSVPVEIHSLIAHELCHAFRLGDEYALPGNKDITIPVSVSYNLQARSTLTTGSQINEDNIQWRWQRIKKAGVLKTAPQPAGPSPGPFTIELRRGHGQNFSQNDEVFLRKRNILADPSLSPKLKIVSITGDVIKVEPVPAATLNLSSRFPKESVLLQPVPASTNTQNNPTGDVHAEILSPIIRKKIKDTGKPLTAATCVEDTSPTQIPINLPLPLIQPTSVELPKIIGLYAGGQEFSCGLFHPSGYCIMRAGIEETGGIRQLREFCHVCKYALVDQINPSEHGRIDAEYNGIYPRKV